MALSDCPHCWATPCECGADYENTPDSWLIMMYLLYERILRKRGVDTANLPRK